MMNSRDFQLIALKAALARTYRYGRIVGRNGDEITVDELQKQLRLNLPQTNIVETQGATSDVNIESVQNISNVTIVEDHMDCHQVAPTNNVNVAPVTESIESNIANLANNLTVSDTISETTKQSVVGKLFQFIKDGKDGSTTT